MEALRECVRMITASAGGCTTPFPFEAAIWLLEEQEELYGGSIPIFNSVHFSCCEGGSSPCTATKELHRGCMHMKDPPSKMP